MQIKNLIPASSFGILLLGVLASPGPTFASALIQIKGKIVSFSPERVQIETTQSEYTIDRKTLSELESKKISKYGVDAVFAVPPHGILKVKKLEPNGKR